MSNEPNRSDSRTPDERTADERTADELNAADPAPRFEAERRRRMTLIAVATVAIIAIVAVVLVLRSRKGGEAEEEKEAAVVSVKVAKAERAPIASQVSALGTIFPRDTAQVSPKISAQIKQMPLWKNRVVRAGEVIAVLEANDLRAQRGEAAAALNEHQEIFKALENRDQAGVTAAMHSHMGTAARRLLAGYDAERNETLG